jgi:membrane protein
VASVLWESGKNLFATSVGQSVRYSTIYGSLAVIPIFLIWIYITWVIVLLGLEITFTHQHFSSLIRKRLYRVMTGRDRTALAIKVYGLIAHRFHSGEPPPTTFELSEHFGAPLEALEDRVVERLVEGGLVQRVGAGSAGAGLVPTRSLEKVMAVDLLRAVIGEPASAPGSENALERAVEELIDGFQLAGEQAIAAVTIRDLLASADADAATSAEQPSDGVQMGDPAVVP